MHGVDYRDSDGTEILECYKSST